MSKKLFVLLVVLMSLSLIGIIFVQGYWIKVAIDNKEEQFTYNVQEVLKTVSNNIQQREIREFSDKLLSLKDSIGTLKETQLREILFIDRDEKNNETFIYSHGILEEDYAISSAFFENSTDIDSTNVKNYKTKRTTTIIKSEYGLDGKLSTPIQKIEKYGNLSSIEKVQYESVVKDIAKRTPIHKRISTNEIELLMQRELNSRGIDIDYEYGVYSKGLATKVRSRGFKLSNETRYKTSLFIDNDGESNYDLLVSFPKKKKFLFSSIIGMALLSIMFTLIIILAYSSALYQLIRQKQISEIKTDFINNMTHEFKTPIATINLALDSMKNPKAFGDSEKVKRYLQMIRDENKRMHAQVENVLRISKLEKNQLDISKDRVDIHDIINDAVIHVSLIVENKGGYVNQHLNANRSEVLANDVHFTNVLVNILDNAIKYSPDAPKIDVFTEVIGNNIMIKIQDQGPGMNKAVLKKIFEKFYREPTGNIHNVKGHGLGLAYVKRIVEDHQGEVFAESEKGKGSTFYIKLPLI
ncbi:HAMP domain-containing sensor histidine kinase [Leptobacterium sp. I13]|uniref:sensor histidine kinase n=1 Tax=Leptobacterium meishanense TaxID=3128904 RepID=UPI0030EDFE40